VRVSGIPEPVEENDAEGPRPSSAADSPFVPHPDPMDWPEAVFMVNARTGLTISANAAAIRLFDAGTATALTGIDLTSLFSARWSEEENRSFREQLQSGKAAVAKADFRTMSGVAFRGVLQADRMEHQGRSMLLVRVFESSRISVVEPVETSGQSTDQFRRMYEEGAFPMVQLGPDYKIRSANRAFTDLLAYRSNELDGTSLFDLIHPEELEQERRVMSQLFRGEMPVSRRDRRLVRRTNEVIWVNLSSSLNRDAKCAPSFVLTMAENVTQKKRLETSVRDSRDRLKDLVDNNEYAILSVDRNHTLLFVNARVADLFFGLTGIVLEPGFNLLDLLPVRFRTDYLEVHQRAFAGEAQVVEKSIELPKGTNHMELVVTPVTGASGKVMSVSFFAHDITQRKKAETEVKSAREKAEASTEAKSTFLATMSHEIRTPLNGVIGMGKLLNQTMLSAKQQEYVDSILLSGEALLSVINDILDISKIESSRMELERKPFALKRCIEETFDLLA
ncbi:MAG: PAS domain S-box protein, partial [Flavobacteriales bacterium]